MLARLIFISACASSQYDDGVSVSDVNDYPPSDDESGHALDDESGHVLDHVSDANVLQPRNKIPRST